MNKVFKIFILFFSISYVSKAQDIEKAINAYYNNQSSERIYIHFDKENYAPGQTIYFKAYLLSNGLPSALSSNFFVQLLNSRNEVFDKKLYPVNGAAVIGSIELPNDIAEGEYYFKAISSNILQYNGDGYGKKILISKNPKQSTLRSSGPAQVRFYPESGHLIDGVLTVVAFKAVDSSGNPVDVSGSVVNSSGVKIPFKTYFNGMGRMQFRPKAGQAYFAEIPWNGKTLRFDLPVVKSSGINLRVEDEKGGKQFLISRIEKDGNELNDITLIAQMDGEVVYYNNISFNDYPSVKGHLLTDSLASGILHFTILNSKMKPIAERLSFVNNREYFHPSEIFIEKGNTGRDYSLKLAFEDVLPSSLSLSVSDADQLQNGSDGLLSNVLLTQNLCCNIYNPQAYFRLKTDSLNNALDNLMLTSTLEDFEWQKILSAKNEPIKKMDDHFITITGAIEDVKEKALVKGGTLNISLVNEDSTLNNYSVPVTPQGSFVIDSLLFYGSGKFYYSYINPSGKKRQVRITLDNEVIEERYNVNRPDSLSKGENKFFVANTSIKEDPSAKELEDVEVHSKTKKPIDIVNETYATGMFRNKGKIVIDNINQPHINRAQSVVKYLEQNLNTVKLQGGKFVNTKNFSLKSMKYWEVGVLLDEVPSTVDNLTVINMEDVALIKFYEAGFSGVSSNTSPGGALTIYLKKNEGSKEAKGSGDYFWYRGYSTVKAFEPEVNSINNFNAPKTSYWNPSVFSPNNGTSLTIPFQINSKAKTVKVVVEGFNTKGRLLHFEKLISNN